MAYTVTQLITDAYYASSVVARQFETVQGYQLSSALNWLNQILQDKTANTGEVPYITTYVELACVPGQEKYYIPNLIDIQSIVFFIQSVRYQMKFVGRGKYFGTPRANNINALPLSYTYERAFGGVNLFLYFFPQENYPLQIVGNTYMNIVSNNQDLTAIIANLGAYTLTGSTPYVLTQSQFVINGVDLQGSYLSINALITAINANVPNVNASIAGTQFILTGSLIGSIQLQTQGAQSTTNNINFANFSITTGPQTKTFTGLDQFYIDFLRYQLADRICKELNFATPDGVREQLDIYRKQIIKLAEPMDLQNQKISCLTRAVGINYAQANIGKGWSTGGGY